MSDKLFLRNGAVGLLQSLVPLAQVGDATLSGAVFDREDYPEDYADALIVANLGALTSDGTVSVTVSVQESDVEGSGFTAITDTNLIDEATMVFTAAGIAYRSLRLNKCKRFIRVVAVLDFTGGTTPQMPVSAVIIGINPRWSPAENN